MQHFLPKMLHLALERALAIYAPKRWYFDEAAARKLAASPRTRKFACPACQKIRDEYPEGIVTF